MMLGKGSPVTERPRSPQDACKKIPVCHWTETDADWSQWSGACGIEWHLTDGGTPKDHGMNYCPKCGKILLS